jgi:hypothetical protein
LTLSRAICLNREDALVLALVRHVRKSGHS